MKSWVAVAFLLVVIALASMNTNPTQNTRQKRATASMADVTKEVISSGKDLVEMLTKLKEALLAPLTVALDALDDEIKKINVRIDGITADERKEVTKALILIYQTQTDVFALKLALTSLAKSTIDRSNRLIKVYKSLKEGEDVHRKIKYAVKKMIQLLNRSKLVLRQSLEKYAEMKVQINSARGHLDAFVESVKTLTKGDGKRMQIWIAQTRASVYGGGAACIIVVASCPFYYAVAASTLETKIKQYKSEVKRLERTASNAVKRTSDLSKEIGENLQYIQEEEKIIKEWEEKVIEMADDYTTVEDVEFYIEIETKEAAIQMLCDLSQICKQYIEHKHPDVQNLGVVAPNLDSACSMD